MHGRVLSTTFLLLALALSGCAEDPSNDSDGDEGLDGIDVKASDDTGVIRGIVVDASIVPIANVVVSIQGRELSTTTNENGAFGFQDLEPGTYFLDAQKPGYEPVQSSTEVEAGVDLPPIVKFQMSTLPGSAPYVQDQYIAGYLTCGMAVFATSVGCTTFGFVADSIGDRSIFSIDYDQKPQWVQGELVWEATQPLAGAFIWEITRSEEPQSPQPHIGYRETQGSPALAYLNESVTEEHGDWIVEKGLDFRFFGGPHELCQIPVARPPGTPVGWGFGCGLTLEQEAEVFLHNFYNFSPNEGWRFTNDGAPEVPL